MTINGNSVGYPLPDPRKGLTMEGAINMNGQALTGLQEPESDNDAATKKYAKTYADGLHRFFDVNLPAAGWSDAAPYTQTIAVEGILNTDRPHWGIVYSEDADTALAEKEAFALVDKLNTADGSVTFTAFEEKPEIDMTIQMEVNR